MSLKLRPLSVEDHADWTRLWTEYLAFYETELPKQMFETTFNRLTDPHRPSQNAIIAFQDGKAVGLVHYIYHDHNWREEQVCYLQDLFAAPTVRGQGIGRALIEAVYKAADDNGTPSVYWLTQDFNTTARQLYDRVATQSPFIVYKR